MKSHFLNKTNYFLWSEPIISLLHSPHEHRWEDFLVSEKKNWDFFAWKTMSLEQYELQSGTSIVNKDRKKDTACYLTANRFSNYGIHLSHST